MHVSYTGLLRFVLCAGAALILLSVTGINNVCHALERLGAPKVFTVQLFFLYRYLFLLMEEGFQMVRARMTRSFGDRGLSANVYCELIGQLLIRSLDRAHRIYNAMQSRGFSGSVHVMRRTKVRRVDLMWAVFLMLLFVILRLNNLPRILGMLITGEPA